VTHPLADGVRAGDRGALARAITLVESERSDHRDAARELLDELIGDTGGALRIGITGSPGSGKSTLIDALGVHAVHQGHRVAVLAVDPSSRRSGGSILGDKTRMVELSRLPDAYIRPSPSGSTLGGVARRTRESLLVCEAGGFDVVLVETVGVGQSEVAVADLVDLFVLIASPSGGDELQGIKRGIMELADLIIVNKADGDLAPAAQRAVADLKSAAQLLRPKRPGWVVEVRSASALTGTGVPAIWDEIERSVETLRSTGDLDRLRAEQSVAWMWAEVEEALLPEVERDVRAGRLAPSSGAARLLDLVAEDGAPRQLGGSPAGGSRLRDPG
jgi:LAO/AO transport system kinase